MKLLIPLIAWSIIYYLYKSISLDTTLSAKDFFIQLYTNNVYYHLWFLYILLGIYMLIPILRYCVKDLPPTYFLYGAILWFIAVPFTKTVNEFVGQPMYFEIPLAGYLGYFLLGYYLRLHTLNKVATFSIYFAGVASAAITIYGTYIGTMNQNGEFYPFFYSNYSPTTAFIAISIFLVFKSLTSKHFSGSIQWMSGLTFGVYLIHALILDVFKQYVTSLQDLTLFTQIPLVAFIVMLISLIISFIISKIPLLNKIMP